MTLTRRQGPPPKALVAGPGALGTALAVALGERGFEVRFRGRDGGMAVHATLETARDGKAPDVRDVRLPAPDAAWQRSAELAFVAVKAFDLESALRATAAALADGAVLIPVANGAIFDVVERVAREFPRLRLRLGFSTLGVSVLGPGRFALRSHSGEVSFGPLVEGESPTAGERALLDPPGSFGWHAGILAHARRKWIYNVVINTLTAARGLVRNGDLLHDLPTLTAVFGEACDLAVALWGPLPLERQALFAGLEKLIERTADNENSMARDRREGRRTETDFMAGLADDPRRYPLLTSLHRQLIADS